MNANTINQEWVWIIIVHLFPDPSFTGQPIFQLAPNAQSKYPSMQATDSEAAQPCRVTTTIVTDKQRKPASNLFSDPRARPSGKMMGGWRYGRTGVAGVLVREDPVEATPFDDVGRLLLRGRPDRCERVSSDDEVDGWERL
ncbi:hypothetical protein EJ08DRAFT_651405 [Tothia fuscella]|uniref:Uncharacterized protein n=1 Tax=Tothia fuscella TaxID=1048955 RepID=A0A9P4TWU1_9PEZI|nr:hypothetical protein EJ08DRAFT_651405 [Tothia fuscella]